MFARLNPLMGRVAFWCYEATCRVHIIHEHGENEPRPGSGTLESHHHLRSAGGHAQPRSTTKPLLLGCHSEAAGIV